MHEQQIKQKNNFCLVRKKFEAFKTKKKKTSLFYLPQDLLHFKFSFYKILFKIMLTSSCVLEVFPQTWVIGQCTCTVSSCTANPIFKRFSQGYARGILGPRSHSLTKSQNTRKIILAAYVIFHFN